MNTVIKHFALAASILMAPALFAQDSGVKSDKTPEEKAAHHTQRMTKELGLSQEQSAKVGDINLRYAQEAAAVKNGSLDKEARKEQAIGLKDRRDEELKLVLTPEQHARMLELRKQKTAEMKAHRGSKKDGQPAPPHNE